MSLEGPLDSAQGGRSSARCMVSMEGAAQVGGRALSPSVQRRASLTYVEPFTRSTAVVLEVNLGPCPRPQVQKPHAGYWGFSL